MNKGTFSQFRFRVVIGLVLVILGCGGKKEEARVDLVTFPLKGEVVSVETERHRVTIAHEEIPNYMMAMTMPFKVKDTTLLLNLQPGDSVQGTLAVSRTESWLEGLTVIGKGEPSRTMSAEDIKFLRTFKEGEPLPDYPLLNQENKRVRLSEFRGKVVALTFVYTRCPIPEFCIRMSDHFSRIQKALSRELSLRGQWHLLTISFDPAYDTPAVLKRYGQTYAADFTTWSFVTGKLEDLHSLADGLGLAFQSDQGGLIAHNLRTILIDPNGNLAKVVQGNEWTPEEIVTEIKRLVKPPHTSSR